MNIVFHSNQLGIRGTEVSLYDYAHYNEVLLGNVSYIAAPLNSDMTTKEKFVDRFGSDRVLLYKDFDEFALKIKQDFKVEVAYFIKAGFNDGKLIPGIKNIVHAVFDGSQPHGDYYIAVSEWLGKRYNIDYMPHIVSLPKVEQDFREYLNIPKNATVFGRYGGHEQFDIEYLSDVIFQSAKEGKYFLLMNTSILKHSHPNIIYFDPTYDLETKTAFINTCDAMIHGRSEGETFGLAIAEFLHQGKPVITNINGKDKNQILIMKEAGFYYTNADELYVILSNFKKQEVDSKKLVGEFHPSIVMKKFNSFINE